MNTKPAFRRSLLILMIVFFLIPFSMRGAKNALQTMKNDPNDWLPSDFPETVDLKWFAKHFVGEKFIVITWPGCTEDDPSFKLFVEKLTLETQGVVGQSSPQAAVGENAESVAGDGGQVAADGGQVAGDALDAALAAAELLEDELAARAAQQIEHAENLRARTTGDRLGLFYTGEYHTNFGERGEKWLRGRGKSTWYFVTPEGELYRWNGGDGALEAAARGVQRLAGNKRVEGELIGNFGKPSSEGHVNRFHRDPRLLTGRVFSTITTGPQLLDQMANADGPLWSTLSEYGDEERELAVKALSYSRLTGLLFGAPPHEDFEWTADDLEKRLPAKTLAMMPENWRTIVTAFAEREGLEQLQAADGFEGELQWGRLFSELGVSPPARQTCIIANLSELGKAEMGRVVGRPILGQPPGVVLRVASEAGISTDEVTGDLRLGGPPVDNVAIDEEGTRTLVKLVGFSALLGFILSYLCFRSIVVTFMVFVVGGVSAVTGLAIVYFTGNTVDAILMSMPAVVYVLGLSGAVHIVNYYRDSLEEYGEQGAPWRALAIGWWPCTLAASTTAIGLLSLYASNIVPIAKFGLYSALGVLATLAMLFSYLPAALTMWSPRYQPGADPATDDSLSTWLNTLVTRFWDRVCVLVTRHHGWVATGCVLVLLVFGAGLFRINTSVKLMKLFDPNAKIINDYYWMEANLGKLVPMEIVIRVSPEMLAENAEDETNGYDADDETEAAKDELDRKLRFNTLERIELADRVQQIVETQFGPRGSDEAGRGMSAATFFRLPGPAPPSSSFNSRGRLRSVMNRKLEEGYDELLDLDYLRKDTHEEHRGSELWRVSLRLGALNDVDYGVFVNDLRFVVEPVMSAYRYRSEILTRLDALDPERSFARKRVLFLGLDAPLDPVQSDEKLDSRSHETQTAVCFSTLSDLLVNKGFVRRYSPIWHDPGDPDSPPLDELLEVADCVVLARDHESYDLSRIETSSKAFVDARDHVFDIDLDGNSTQPTSAKRNTPIHAIYTGVVPVIYKAQRTLLRSLMESIGWAFCLIALVMMFLLRSGRFSNGNIISFRGGLISMLPNVFPVILIFGAMGHLGVAVDIGSMMTASVAMGVAVDDTIHFLIWFRKGIRAGKNRADAIRNAYAHVATAMTQTTIIGGLGLSVFWLSTFTPTQRFGVLMLTLLAAALIGDLIFLPAILAGRWGKYFCPEVDEEASIEGVTETADPSLALELSGGGVETPHSRRESGSQRIVRHDRPH